MIAVNVLSSSYILYFIVFPILPHAVCGLQFTAPFNGNMVTGVLGSSVNFTWAFHAGNINRVAWGTKKGGPVGIEDVLISIDKVQTIRTIQNPPYSGRVSGIWDGSSPGQATFTLNSIQKADERFYVCKLTPVRLDVLDVYDTVQLLVVAVPKIDGLTAQSNYTEGSAVSITCTASGTPDPDVQWIRNGKVKHSGKNTVLLTFSSINRSDGGQYTCRANNSLGSAENHTTLVVHHPPSIKEATSSAAKSWIGQTETLKCAADGVPTPTLTWSKPNGSQINSITSTQNTVNVIMSVDQDFGGYKCVADNRLTPANFKIVKIEQIKTPGSPAIVQFDILATSLTVKWTAPADDGGSPITAYRVVVLKNGAEIKNVNITDPGTTSWNAGSLERNTTYTVKVLARNAVFEGFAAEKEVRTKYEEPPTVTFKSKGSSCNELVLHIVYIIIILVLLIVILTFVLRRLRSGAAISKRNRRNLCAGCGGELVVLNTMDTETKRQSSSIVPSGDSTTDAAPSSRDCMSLHPSAQSWELNREQIKILKVIGKGAFSQVAKATAWNISGEEKYSTVAVKMLKGNALDSDRNDLLSELEVMKKLKPHPHVIKLMGCVTESDPLLVLIEYVPYGDLLGYLRKSRGLKDTYFKDPDVKPQTNLTAEQLMRFAWQIADGMFYLSSRKIIHRDLAARNVLVGEGEKCKVTDFGMARNVQQDDIYTKRSRGRLPVKWTAYEALLFGTYTTQSDVWSYGVLLYEILTVGGSPYPGIQARQIASKLQEGFRMPKPKHVDNKLYQIMLKCWEENPSDRPTFTKLKDTMKEMERNHRTYVNLKWYDNNLYANVEDLTAE